MSLNSIPNRAVEFLARQAQEEPAGTPGGEPAKVVCGSNSHRGPYNTSAHVAALVLILVLSTLACSFPITVRRFPRLPVPHRFLFLSRHFGTGVLIATAFVHLLPTAFVSLTDPCLPPFWNKGYPAMAGFIAMVSVMAVVGIEMFFATRGAKHVHGGDYKALEEDGIELLRGQAGMGMAAEPHGVRTDGLVVEQPWKDVPSSGLAAGQHRDMDAADVPSSSDSYEENKRTTSMETPEGSDLDLDELDEAEATLHTRESTLTTRPSAADDRRLAAAASGEEQSDEQRQHADKLLLQCLLLEAGILFHSIFIGMAVSVAVGAPFVVLLIAISFHQTFEGLALGSRIAAVTAFGPGSIRPWLMALAYGTTTPLGQAIGLLMHKMYDPESQAGLLMVGFMNAISSGLLLFAGLVELLAEDFLSEDSYKTLQGRKRLEACAAVVAGCLMMALVGAWA